jgi:hypothetical protein
MKNLCSVLNRLRRVCAGVTLNLDEHYALRRHRMGAELLLDGKRIALVRTTNPAQALRALQEHTNESSQSHP